MTKQWYQDKFNLVVLGTLLILSASAIIPFLHPLYDAYIEYMGMIWWAILLGFLLGGIIDYYIPEEYIIKYLSGGKKRSIFFAAILGFFMSACSHGILAISMQLYKKGASPASVVTFLLAAPWANVAMTILFFSFFGIKALALILVALLIAFTTGVIYQLLDQKGLIESSKSTKESHFSLKKDLQKRWKSYRFTPREDLVGILKGAWDLNKMVTWWILIGILFAAMARAYVPSHFFMGYMGPNPLGMVVTLFFATILEVCSEGSAPMAFEVYHQTSAFGNAFIFLMAGVATDYTEIGLIWSNIGRKSALWLPTIVVPQVLFWGWVFNQ